MLFLLSTLALADVPPPPGYKESCTVKLQCGPEEVGTTCDGWHGGREACEALEADGWTKKCQTRGASTWDEVFCRPKKEGENAGEINAGLPTPATNQVDQKADDPQAAPATDPTAKSEPETPAADPSLADDEPKRCSTVPSGLAGIWVLLFGAGLIRRRSSCEGTELC